MNIYSLETKDADIIHQQMKGRKFNRDLLLGVASRCRCGRPQVILCKSLLNGTPFPTNFWLSCPVLVKIAGQAESSGGVTKLELYITENSLDVWEKYSRLHSRIRVILADKSELEYLKQNNLTSYKKFCDNGIGIGGIKIEKEVRIKCLHLQFASYLSLGFHPGQDWLKNIIPSFNINN